MTGECQNRLSDKIKMIEKGQTPRSTVRKNQKFDDGWPPIF